MKGISERRQWRFQQKALSKAVAACIATGLLGGCFGGGGGSSNSAATPTAPSAPTAPTSPAPIEEITSKTVAATQVAAVVRVPSATTVKTQVVDRGINLGVDDFLLALKGLIPEALALEEGDLKQVSGDEINILDIDLLRFTRGSGYEVVKNTDGSSLTEAQKNEVFSKDSEGNLTIDLEALAADPNVEFEAALDTALAIRVKLTLEGVDKVNNDTGADGADGNDDVIELRAPLVSENSDISPVSEFVVSVIGSSVDTDLSNLNITEVRNLLSAAFEVSVAGGGSVADPRDLVAGLEEAAGAQIEEQFEGYQAEEPVAETITGANGTYNVLVFEQALFGATPESGFTFGDESHFIERASVALNIDSGGNGTVQYNTNVSSFIAGEAGLAFGNGISLEAESFTSGEAGDAGSAELHSNGNVLLTFPGEKEFDTEFSFWNVSDPFKLTLRSMGLAAGGRGRIGVGFGTENEFGDTGGAPDFGNHIAHQNFVPLLLTLPQSSVSAADFIRDMGVVGIKSSAESSGSNSFFLGYSVGDELITATGTAGEFSGGTNASFEIERNEFGTTSFSETNVNSDTLTFGNFSNGVFNITSTEGGGTESAGFGIAAPNGDLIAAIAFEVECRNDETGVVRLDTDTLNCNDGETPLDADTVLFVGVPVAATPSLQEGDRYRYVNYSLDTQGGVGSCRGDVQVDGTNLSLSNRKCTSVERVGAPDTSVSAISTVALPDAAFPFQFSGQTFLLGTAGSVRGFVSEDRNTIIFRFSDPSDPTFVGIFIASRVLDSSTP